MWLILFQRIKKHLELALIGQLHDNKWYVWFAYLTAWWRHNCDTSHVMNIYLIEIHVKIKYVKFEDKVY